LKKRGNERKLVNFRKFLENEGKLVENYLNWVNNKISLKSTTNGSQVGEIYAI
jgi:hypothetical protein